LKEKELYASLLEQVSVEEVLVETTIIQKRTCKELSWRFRDLHFSCSSCFRGFAFAGHDLLVRWIEKTVIMYTDGRCSL